MTREEVVNELNYIYESFATNGLSQEALTVAIKALKEQKTGKWIVDDEYIDCSYCRREKWSRVPFEQLVSGFRFCPNCGSYNGGDEE